jgi:mannose-1-phosphate guanylyltransferase
LHLKSIMVQLILKKSSKIEFIQVSFNWLDRINKLKEIKHSNIQDKLVSYKHLVNQVECQMKNVLIISTQTVLNMIGMYKIGLKPTKKCFWD